MFRCSHTIIRESINSCLLKLQLLKWPIKIHRFVVNTVVMWLHILVGPCWCVYVALFGSRLSLQPNSVTNTHQQGPTNICSHITTHRCILIGYFNNCNFSRHE
jgi:hypothetical protein